MIFIISEMHFEALRKPDNVDIQLQVSDYILSLTGFRYTRMHSLAILYTLRWHSSSVHKFASKEKLPLTEKTSLEELLLQF